MNKSKILAEPGKQELFITREFDAPRELVLKAHTEATLFAQWIGPRNHKITITKFVPVSGGGWRYVSKDKKGNEFGFHGVYHEVLSPERSIDTFKFEGLPEKGHVILEVLKLEELPGRRTKLTVQNVFLSIANRDGMLQSGMESGINESYDRLDKLLEKMNKEK